MEFEESCPRLLVERLVVNRRVFEEGLDNAQFFSRSLARSPPPSPLDRRPIEAGQTRHGGIAAALRIIM